MLGLFETTSVMCVIEYGRSLNLRIDSECRLLLFYFPYISQLHSPQNVIVSDPKKSLMVRS